MNVRNVFGVVFLVAAAAATWYWSLPETPPTAGPVADTGPLGYYLIGARLLGTDDAGHVTYVVHAERAEESSDEGLLALNGVRVEYSPINDVAWRVSASHATAPKAGSYLELSGEVELRSEPRDGGEPMVIATTSLHLTPDEFSAVSDQPVLLRVGANRLEAVGLKAHLKDDSVQLESNVHGQFVP